MANTAQKVREHKEKHPELYCSKCLWKTGGGNCPRHKTHGLASETSLSQVWGDQFREVLLGGNKE